MGDDLPGRTTHRRTTCQAAQRATLTKRRRDILYSATAAGTLGSLCSILNPNKLLIFSFFHPCPTLRATSLSLQGEPADIRKG